MTIGLILAALFLPPLAIFLAEGLGRHFWIAAGLTCLGWLPGAAFAFFILLNRAPAATGDVAQAVPRR
ncbi:MAG TPA: YqaE/Pmp3 family membrane protein [Allosphingosinicella sp.]|nr:YqaE/Pmp3 family membrane protein [Allosphingosinicella sp.]